MRAAFALLTCAATASAHGGLTFPPSRNNYHQKDPTNRSGSSWHDNGAFCTGDQCLWFNEGCCATQLPLRPLLSSDDAPVRGTRRGRLRDQLQRQDAGEQPEGEGLREEPGVHV